MDIGTFKKKLITCSHTLAKLYQAIEDEKVSRQILSSALKFRDLAFEIRIGVLQLTDDAIDICDKELEDMIDAIDTGKSSEKIVVETLECIDAIEAHREFTE